MAVKRARVVREGVAHISASFSNTKISISDAQGNIIAWASAGMAGFKGARKGTSHAAQTAAEMAAKKAIEQHGLQCVAVRISGPGQGRESASRALHAAGLEVTEITDCTPDPHNGCKRKKQRRI
jgi:small subunit ribosomal protein S11